jgi:ferrous iron transport protein A
MNMANPHKRILGNPFHHHTPFFRVHRSHSGEQMLPDQTEVPLGALSMGEHAIVYALCGGRTVSNRLVSLGFTPGVELDMVQNFRHGPLIVELRGTRVALGRGEAEKILVRRKTL